MSLINRLQPVFSKSASTAIQVKQSLSPHFRASVVDQGRFVTVKAADPKQHDDVLDELRLRFGEGNVEDVGQGQGIRVYDVAKSLTKSFKAGDRVRVVPQTGFGQRGVVTNTDTNNPSQPMIMVRLDGGMRVSVPASDLKPEKHVHTTIEKAPKGTAPKPPKPPAAPGKPTTPKAGAKPPKDMKGKPCEPGYTAARSGCIPKKKPVPGAKPEGGGKKGGGKEDREIHYGGKKLPIEETVDKIAGLRADGKLDAESLGKLLKPYSKWDLKKLKGSLGIKLTPENKTQAEAVAAAVEQILKKDHALPGWAFPEEDEHERGGKVGGSDGEGGGGTGGGAEEDGGAVEGEAEGPDSEGDAGERQGQTISASEGATENVRGGDTAGGGEGVEGVDYFLGKLATATKSKVHSRIKRYRDHFKKAGNKDMVSFLAKVWRQVDEIGVEAAMEALGVDPDPVGEIDQVQYKSTANFEDPEMDKDFVGFLSKYLDRAGIILQTGVTPVPGIKVVAGAPVPSAAAQAKPGDVVPVESNLPTKLEESKHLPGLETTEDLGKIMGQKDVKRITPEVIKKLDQKYGKNKWIIKSYGDESYAGFGIFLPPKIKRIKENAQAAIIDAGDSLGEHGYKVLREKKGLIKGLLSRDKGPAIGVKDLKTGKIYKFDNGDVGKIEDKEVRRLARIAETNAPYEQGAILPGGPVESVRQEFHVNITRDEKGDVNGIIDPEGKEVKFDLLRQDDGVVLGIDPHSPAWKKFARAWDPYDEGKMTHEIDRAVAAAYNKSEVKFMAQPAFESIGVTEEDQALGLTWETGTEGRVHVVIKDGKASVVPYATMRGRADFLPVVFRNADIEAMERAAQEAVDALPESERKGQVYAPDVMKTKQGWKVVEVNASATEGSSQWLEQNPYVIDAYVSHISGREPIHAKFIRNLLRDKFKGGRPKVRAAGAELAKPQPSEGGPGKKPASKSYHPTRKGVWFEGTKARRTVYSTVKRAKYVRKGRCKPGERADLTGCEPASGKGRPASGRHTKPAKPGGSKPGEVTRRKMGKLITRTNYGSIRATYATFGPKKIDGPHLNLPNYKQQDVHSCGFVAALTVTRYFEPNTSAREVLKAVRPLINNGVNRHNLRKALAELGVKTDYRKDLTFSKLRKYVNDGVPVIVSVWPDEWISDHWTIVQGFDDEKGVIYLTNHKSLTYPQFKREWSDMDMRGKGNSKEGIICEMMADRPVPPAKKTGKAKPRKKSSPPSAVTKGAGEPCKPGETAARTSCVPASGEGNKPKAPKEKPGGKAGHGKPKAGHVARRIAQLKKEGRLTVEAIKNLLAPYSPWDLKKIKAKLNIKITPEGKSQAEAITAVAVQLLTEGHSVAEEYAQGHATPGSKAESKYKLPTVSSGMDKGHIDMPALTSMIQSVVNDAALTANINQQVVQTYYDEINKATAAGIKDKKTLESYETYGLYLAQKKLSELLAPYTKKPVAAAGGPKPPKPIIGPKQDGKKPPKEETAKKIKEAMADGSLTHEKLAGLLAPYSPWEMKAMKHLVPFKITPEGKSQAQAIAAIAAQLVKEKAAAPEAPKVTAKLLPFSEPQLDYLTLKEQVADALGLDDTSDDKVLNVSLAALEMFKTSLSFGNTKEQALADAQVTLDESLAKELKKGEALVDFPPKEKPSAGSATDETKGIGIDIEFWDSGKPKQHQLTADIIDAYGIEMGLAEDIADKVWLAADAIAGQGGTKGEIKAEAYAKLAELLKNHQKVDHPPKDEAVGLTADDFSFEVFDSGNVKKLELASEIAGKVGLSLNDAEAIAAEVYGAQAGQPLDEKLKIGKAKLNELLDKAGYLKKAPKPPKPGFTGTDSLGRKWVNGELVAKVDEAPAVEVPLHDESTGEPKIGKLMQILEAAGVPIESSQVLANEVWQAWSDEFKKPGSGKEQALAKAETKLNQILSEGKAPPAAGAGGLTGSITGGVIPPALSKPAVTWQQAKEEANKTNPHAAGGPWGPKKTDKKTSYGGVVFNAEGKVLLVEPATHYDGFHWTWPKGGQEPGHTPADTAVKEVGEETGTHGKITGQLPGTYDAGYAHQCFYVMEADGEDPHLMDLKPGEIKETESIRWVTVEEAEALLSQSTNTHGKKNDLNILKNVKEYLAKIKGGADPWTGKTKSNIPPVDGVGEGEPVMPTGPVVRIGGGAPVPKTYDVSGVVFKFKPNGDLSATSLITSIQQLDPEYSYHEADQIAIKIKTAYGQDVANGFSKEDAEKQARFRLKEELEKAPKPISNDELILPNGYSSLPFKHKMEKAPKSHKDMAAKHFTNISEAARKAYRYYTGNGYGPLNTKMAECPPHFECLSPGQKKLKDEIDEAVFVPLPDVRIVGRGVASATPELTAANVEAAIKCMETGATWQMPTVSSCSYSSPWGSSLQFVIKAKTGLAGGGKYKPAKKPGQTSEPAEEYLSTHPHEDELVQSAKCKYKVVGVDRKKGGQAFIYLEEFIPRGTFT